MKEIMYIIYFSSGSGTVINYGSGSDFLTSYGSGSIGQKVTVPPTVPVLQRCFYHCFEIMFHPNPAMRFHSVPVPYANAGFFEALIFLKK
jgi:hypothetical protein